MASKSFVKKVLKGVKPAKNYPTYKAGKSSSASSGGKGSGKGQGAERANTFGNIAGMTEHALATSSAIEI